MVQFCVSTEHQCVSRVKQTLQQQKTRKDHNSFTVLYELYVSVYICHHSTVQQHLVASYKAVPNSLHISTHGQPLYDATEIICVHCLAPFQQSFLILFLVAYLFQVSCLMVVVIIMFVSFLCHLFLEFLEHSQMTSWISLKNVAVCLGLQTLPYSLVWVSIDDDRDCIFFFVFCSSYEVQSCTRCRAVIFLSHGQKRSSVQKYVSLFQSLVTCAESKRF